MRLPQEIPQKGCGRRIIPTGQTCLNETRTSSNLNLPSNRLAAPVVSASIAGILMLQSPNLTATTNKVALGLLWTRLKQTTRWGGQEVHESLGWRQALDSNPRWIDQLKY